MPVEFKVLPSSTPGERRREHKERRGQGRGLLAKSSGRQGWSAKVGGGRCSLLLKKKALSSGQRGPHTGPPGKQPQRPPDLKANEPLAGTRDASDEGGRVASQRGERRPGPLTHGCGAQAAAFPAQGRDASGQGGQQESFSGFKHTPGQRPPRCSRPRHTPGLSGGPHYRSPSSLTYGLTPTIRDPSLSLPLPPSPRVVRTPNWGISNPERSARRKTKTL